MGRNLEGDGYLSVTEDLHEVTLVGETGSDEGFGIEGLHAKLLGNFLQGADIDAMIFNAGGIAESELGQTPLDRHLATLESYLVLITGTGLGAFGTTGGSAALTGTLTATDAL